MIRLLLENGRLALLPVIAAQFEKLKAEQSGMLEAEIVSAFPLALTQEKEDWCVCPETNVSSAK